MKCTTNTIFFLIHRSSDLNELLEQIKPLESLYYDKISKPLVYYPSNLTLLKYIFIIGTIKEYPNFPVYWRKCTLQSKWPKMLISSTCWKKYEIIVNLEYFFSLFFCRPNKRMDGFGKSWAKRQSRKLRKSLRSTTTSISCFTAPT